MLSVYFSPIEGFILAYPLEIGVDEGEKSGVFLDSSQRNKIMTSTTTGSGEGKVQFDFKASNGNSVYIGDKVQAAALQVLACIKI